VHWFADEAEDGPRGRAMAEEARAAAP